MTTYPTHKSAFDEETLRIAYYQAYMDKDVGDPHGKFAELLGISRNDAKTEVYRFIYSYPCQSFKSWREDMLSGLRMYQFIRDNYNSTLPPLKQILEEMRKAQDA